MSQLPIVEIVPALLDALQQKAQVILQAPAGSGKSTGLPGLLLKEYLADGDTIVMLEPRRLAVKAIATRLAEQLGEPLGQTIGYRMRGESNVSSNTRLIVVTDGILTRMLQRDPELQGVSLIIFDEFHERSVQGDLALALAIEAQQEFAPEVKLLLMSATLDSDILSKLLPYAAQLNAKGRQFPVTRHFRPWNRQQPLIPMLGRVALEALARHMGDGLIFLPGEFEIRQLCEWLSTQLPAQVTLSPLYGRLDLEQQRRAILPSISGRKVVLATNIAETSLTIEGVRWVVDSGLERRQEFHLRDGIDGLQLKQIALSSANQRAGRAGRVAAGDCYCLWDEAQHQRLEGQRPAEMMRSDLVVPLLEAKLWGSSLEVLPLPESPPKANLEQASTCLRSLGLLDEKHGLTPLGRRVAVLGLHPRLGRMLLRAKRLESNYPGIIADACHLAAALELRILDQHASISEILVQHRARLKSQARRFFRRLERSYAPASGHWVALLLALGFPEQLARRSNHRYRLASGRQASLANDSALGCHEWLAIADLRHTEHGIRIYGAEPFAIDEMQTWQPDLFSQNTFVAWDETLGRTRAERQLKLGAIVLEAVPIGQLDPKLQALGLLEGIRNQGLHILPWDEASEQYWQRICCAGSWLSDLGFPHYDETRLLDEMELWLLPALSGMGRLEQLKRINLQSLLRDCLGWSWAKELDRLLPTHFETPTANRVLIHYDIDQEPLIQVRLQEMFGQVQTPRIVDGRIALTIELLSPAMRPLQRTSDLSSFWLGAYREVRKEMRGRYPKHYWPEEPLLALPTRQVKKRMEINRGRK